MIPLTPRNEPGSLVWNDAAIDDPEAAREFYTAVFAFSWEPVEGMAPHSTFSTGGDPLGGLGGVSRGLPRGWATCFAASSTDDAVSRVEASAARC